MHVYDDARCKYNLPVQIRSRRNLETRSMFPTGGKEASLCIAPRLYSLSLSLSLSIPWPVSIDKASF